jgi:diguanylate cyclase (GGDEF)-like protein
MGKPETPLSSGQPDPRILAFLGRLQSIFLAAAIFAGATTLLAWLIPPLARILPHGWDVMKANTAVFIIGSSLSLFLWQPRRSLRSLRAARVLAGLVALLAATTLVEVLTHRTLHIDTLLAADASSHFPGRMSIQTAWAALIIGIILTSLRARKRILATVIDLLTLCLTLLVLTFISGYVFGALHIYGVSLQNRIAPQTLFCVALITFVIITRRSEYGVVSILLGSGIGGRTARLAAPWAICLPFLLTMIRGLVRRFTSVPSEDSLAVSSSIMSICGFCLILALSRKTDRLENAIRELSLRDDLTKLYNRRGFYLLAEQAMRLTHRAGDPFFVLFIDMDNLKVLNDTHGHDVGSEHLKQLAALIDRTFRETDVVGRLGGDEFIVAGKGNDASLRIALDRLHRESHVAATSVALEFSFGYVISHRGSANSLEELVEQADAIMYEAKRKKKQAPTLGILSQSGAPPAQSLA